MHRIVSQLHSKNDLPGEEEGLAQERAAQARCRCADACVDDCEDADADDVLRLWQQLRTEERWKEAADQSLRPCGPTVGCLNLDEGSLVLRREGEKH